MDEGGYVIDVLTPAGTSLDETNHILQEIEQRVAKMPETDTFSRRTGVELGLYATEQNKSDILVKLKLRSQRKRSAEEVMDDMREQIAQNISGIDVEFTQILQDMLGDLEGSPEPVEIKLFGNDSNVLEQVAATVGPKIVSIPGVVDFVGVQKGNPEIVFHVDPALSGRAGLTPDEVSQQVSAGFIGAH